MATTINHTGRRKLKRSEYAITLHTETNKTPTFDLQLAVDKIDSLGSASVIVEANIGNQRQRFEFGTVSKLVQPADTSLNALPATGTPKFSVLIIDKSQTHGLLLARASDARPQDDEQDSGSSLLVIKTYPLEEMLWTINMVAGNRPELILNNRLPDFIHLLKTDPVYQGLILPSAMRLVLTRYAQMDDYDEESDPVQAQWWKLAEQYGQGEKPEGDDDDFETWMDSVVAGFSKAHGFCSSVLTHLEAQSA